MDFINDLYQNIFLSIFIVFGKIIYNLNEIGDEYLPLINNFNSSINSKKNIYLDDKLLLDEKNEKLNNIKNKYMVFNFEKKHNFTNLEEEKKFRSTFDYILRFLDNYLIKDNYCIIEDIDKILLILNNDFTNVIISSLDFFNYKNIIKVSRRNNTNNTNNNVVSYVKSLFYIKEVNCKESEDIYNFSYLYNMDQIIQSRFVDFLLIFYRTKDTLSFISHHNKVIINGIHYLFSLCKNIQISDIKNNDDNYYFKYIVNKFRYDKFKYLNLLINVNLYFSNVTDSYKVVNVLLNYNKCLKNLKKEKEPTDYFVFDEYEFNTFVN